MDGEFEISVKVSKRLTNIDAFGIRAFELISIVYSNRLAPAQKRAARKVILAKLKKLKKKVGTVLYKVGDRE